MTEYNPQGPAEPANTPVPWTAGSAPSPSPNVQATMQQMTQQLQTVIDAAERAAEAIRYDAEEQARRHLAEAQRKADRLTAERVGLISELTDDLVRHAANVRDHSEQMVRALEDAITSVTDKLEQPAMTNPFPSADPPGPPLPFTEPLNAGFPPQPPETQVAGGSYTDLVGDRPIAEAPPPPGAGAPPPPVPSSDPTGDPHHSHSVPAEPTAYGGSAAQPGAVNPPSTAVEPQGDQELDVPQEGLFRATRLAVAGVDRGTIEAVLRDDYGVSDPGPVVDRVLGVS